MHTSKYIAISFLGITTLVILGAVSHRALSQFSIIGSIQVTYPNGGECFVPGDTVAIQWTGLGYDHVAIGYRTGSQASPLPYLLAPGDWNIEHPVQGSSYDRWNTTGLSTGVLYKIWVEGHDVVHTTVAPGDSSDGSFGFATSCGTGTTNPTSDTIAPTVSGVQATNISSSSAVITLTTNELSFVKVEYGIANTFENSTPWTTTSATSHSVSLSGLTSATTYKYKAVAQDAAGNLGHSAESTLTTFGSTTSLDTTPPTVSITDPVNGATVSGIKTIKASASDNVGVSKVEFYKGMDFLFGSDAAAPYEYSWYTTQVPNGSYAIYAKAYDTSNNFAMSSSVSLNVSNTVVTTDTTPPVISGVGSTNISGSSATIVFVTNEPSFSKVEYGTTSSYGSSTNWTTSSATSHSLLLSGLTSGTLYHYRAVAKDASGNTSYSLNYTFTTSSGSVSSTDSQVPTVSITSPKNGDTVSGTVTVEVSASDNVGVSMVEIYLDELVWLGSVSAPPYQFAWGTKIATDGSHVLSAVARDAAGNPGKHSISLTVSNGSVAPPPVSGETATLKGIVLDPDGKPLAGVYVDVHTENYSLVFSGMQSAADGSYSVVGIIPGSYLIDVYPPQANPDFISPSRVTKTFESGMTVTHDAKFSRSSKILKGRVLDNAGVPIPDAFVSAYNETTNFGKSVDADTLGYYSLSLKGGTWSVGVEPKDKANARWSYSQPPTKISFVEDTTAQTQTLNFTVTKTDAFVKGKVLLSDGGIPDPNKVFASLRSTLGYEVHVQLSSTGSFYTAVPAGSYEMNIWVDDPAIKAPTVPSFSVVSGTTYDMGTITLIRAVEHIKGRVIDSQAKSVSGIRVNAWIPDGKGFASATTNTLGEYDLLVTPGTWEVMVDVQGSNYILSGGPRKVSVMSGTVVAGVDFVLALADATVSGTVVNATGKVIEDFYGFAFAIDSLSPGEFKGGGSVDRGRFSFKVAAGSYKVNVDVPPGSPYSPGLPQSVSVVPGGTATVTITLRTNDARITGTLRDASGNRITGVFAEVFAGSEQGVWQRGALDTLTGSYTLNVSSGTWHVGVHVDSASGYVSGGEPISLTILSGQTLTRDFTLTRAASTLNVTVKDPDGNPFPNVWVSVDKISFSTVETEKPETFSDVFVVGGSANSRGQVSLRVPVGIFFVHAFYPSEKGFINPKEAKVVIDKEGDSVDVILQFRRASLTVSGRVLLGGIGVEAFVWAWSDGGGYTDARSSSIGAYSIAVTGSDRWHIGADKYFADSNERYYSSELVVDVGDASLSGKDITLVKSSLVVPASTSKTTSATDFETVSLEDGAKVSIPANSLGSTGNFTVAITPDAEVPKQGMAKVVGTGYNIEARDASGQIVGNLNSAITIILPYTDAALKEAGVASDDLSAAFWDETVSTWRKLTNAVNDKTNKRVTATVDHLTRFALIAPAAAAFTPSGASSDTPVVEQQVTSAEDLREGDLIRGPDGIKVYIINEHGYKRHIFNPAVFNMYGHLSWESIKKVSQTTLDLYEVSDLYRADVDPKVYSLEEIDEANGIAVKRWLDMTPERFLGIGYKWQQVFIVNEKERDYYRTGESLN